MVVKSFLISFFTCSCPGFPAPFIEETDFPALYSLASFHFSLFVVSNSLRPHGLQHARLPCPLQLPELAQISVHWVGDAIQPSSVIPFSSCLQSFPASGSFLSSQIFASGDQTIGASASASVRPVNIQDWCPLGWTGWISLQAKRLSSLLQHHSSKASILRHSAFFMVQFSHSYVTTEKTIALYIEIFVGKVTSLLFNTLSRLVIAFLPRRKRLLISWLQSPSAVILEPQKNKIWHCFYSLPIYLPWSDGTRCYDLCFLNVEL